MTDTDVALHRLLTPPAFRRAVALAHAVPGLCLKLHLRDGRTARVSHDPAFVPVLSPCHLRQAIEAHRRGEPPAWLIDVGGWDLASPFVEPLGDRLVRHHPDGPEVVFATSLTAEVVQSVLGALEVVGLEGIDADARARHDALLGITTVHLTRRSAAHPALLLELGRAASRACRDVEPG